MAQDRQGRTFDYNLYLKDAGLLAASAACQVGGSDKILDLGTGRIEGEVVIDVSACEVDTGDELYQIGVQISSSATFASDIYEVGTLKLGDAAVLPGDVDMTTGRFILPFVNEMGDGLVKRYLRLYVTISGTIATGINFKAYGVRKP